MELKSKRFYDMLEAGDYISIQRLCNEYGDEWVESVIDDIRVMIGELPMMLLSSHPYLSTLYNAVCKVQAGYQLSFNFKYEGR